MNCSSLIAEDNGAYALGGESLRIESVEILQYTSWLIARGGCPHPNVCRECGFIRRRFPIEKFSLGRRDLDFSTTYDGYLIVSANLRTFLEDHLAIDYFIEPDGQPGFFIFDHFQLPVLAIDRASSAIRESPSCSLCGQAFYQLYGMTPDRPPKIRPLVVRATPGEGAIDRSDIELGSTHGRSPAILVGAKLRDQLAARAFKGLSFETVEAA